MARFTKGMLALGAVAALTLTACSGGGSPATSAPADTGGTTAPATTPATEGGGLADTTIKILAPSYGDTSEADWNRITAKFNEEHPNVKVELQIAGWDDFANTVQSRIQAGDLPDILNDNAFAASADAGLLIPIDELLSADTLANIEPGLLSNGKGADGVQWAAPDIASARMLVYNTDLFAQAGISEAPKTWAEMEAAAKAISDLGADIYGYGMPLGAEEAQVESSLWLWGAGGTWVDGENLVANSPAAIEGFTQMKKMFDEGLTQPNLEDDRQATTDLLSAGKLGMAVGHGQVVADATAKGINVKLAPVPSKDGSGVATGVTDFILAFDNDDEARKAATAAYLDLFYSDELYEPWYKGTALLPVTKSSIESAKAGASETDAAFLDAMDIVKFQPVSNPQWDALSAALKANAFRVGTEDPATVLEQIEAQVAAQA